MILVDIVIIFTSIKYLCKQTNMLIQQSIPGTIPNRIPISSTASMPGSVIIIPNFKMECKYMCVLRHINNITIIWKTVILNRNN